MILNIGELNAGHKMDKSTGSGEIEKQGRGAMEEVSKHSVQKDKQPTGKTGNNLTIEEALEILTKSLRICEKAGLPVVITPLYDQGEESTGIILPKVKISGRKLVSTGKSTGNQPESTGSNE